MSNPNIQSLEFKIDELLSAYKQLERENRLLIAEREAWKTERDKLIRQNDLARSRVEAMIERLRSMELPNV